MAKTTKKPSAKKAKIKTPKPAKPKKVSILDTDLLPLKEADELLTRIETQSAAVKLAEIEYETADDARKAAKGAMNHARNELQKLCDARKEQHPLFQQQEKALPKQDAKSEPVTLPTVIITRGQETHGLKNGAPYEIVEVKPGGLVVANRESGSNPTAILDGEYKTCDDTAALVEESRENKAEGSEAWAKFVASKQAKPVPAQPTSRDEWMSLPLDAAKINGKGGKLLAEAGYETLGAVVKLMKDHGQWWPKEVTGIGEEIGGKISDQIAEFFAAHSEYTAS